MNLMMNLSELEIGKDAVIESVDCSEISLRKHILKISQIHLFIITLQTPY